MPSLVRLGCPNASRAASKFRRSSCVQLQCFGMRGELSSSWWWSTATSAPSLFGSFFCFFTCLPGMELSEIRSITHTFAVAHTRSLSLSLFQSNSVRILIFLLHLLTSIYFYLLSCRTLYFTDLAKPIGTDSMNIPTASLPAPLSFLKGSSFNLTARLEVALRPFPEIVQPSIKTLEIFNKNYLGLVFLDNATQGAPPKRFRKILGNPLTKKRKSASFSHKNRRQVSPYPWPAYLSTLSFRIHLRLLEKEILGAQWQLELPLRFSFSAFIASSLFLGTHLSQHMMAFFFFLSEAFKITDDGFPNEVAEANTVTREPSASCVAGIPLVNFCHCRTGNAGASQMTHQLMP